MSEIEMNLAFPLDDDGFFRRSCPLCNREFKVLLEKDELADLAQRGLDSFMIESFEESDPNQSEDLEDKYVCPYCGQRSRQDDWWTQEQVAYLGVVFGNIAAELTNKNLIRPLKDLNRKYRSDLISIQFDADEMEYQEPWISPESNDMEVFSLACCDRKIKIEEAMPDILYCFFCGFPHKSDSKGE